MLRHRLFLEWLSLCAAACVLAVWSIHSGLTERIDAQILDFSTGLARPAPSSDIVIVAIDDDSLASIGSWPWSRNIHAELIDRLSAAGAQQIVYDVLFIEPTDQNVDQNLAASFKQAGNVIIPHTFGRASGSDKVAAPIYPVEELARSARAIGHVSVEPDADGLLRRFALELSDDQRRYPHLSVAAYRAVGEDAGEGLTGLPAGAPTWPVASFNPLGSFSTVSAADVLSGTLPSGVFSGKVALVGATAQGMGDRFSVPAGQISIMSGVETQANLLNTLRSGSFVAEFEFMWTAALSCLVIMLQFLAFWKLPPRSNLFATIVIIGGVLLATVLAVALGQIWIAPGPTLMVLALAYPLWSWRRLTSVSSFLEVEAMQLTEVSDQEVRSGGFDVIARQVHRMKNLVRNVNSSLVFLRQTIEASPDPMIVLNRDGAIEMWNAKAAQLFPDCELSDRPSLPELFLSGQISVGSAASEITMFDGRTFLMAKGAFDNTTEFENGEVVVLRDISQLRRQESERREVLEFLSHDMRTPQVAIVGLTQRSAASIDSRDRLERIQVQAQRTLKLADDFVHLARLEEAELLFEETDLVSLVHEACDRAFATSRKKSITLARPHQDEPVIAQVEASLIARLLDNLVGNAIKFSPAGSTVAIHLSTDKKGDAVLEVADEGPGFSPERRANPFARYGAHDSKAGPSVGLGLTFVQQTVLKHRGEIEVESGADTGTRFRIVLPREQL